VNRSPWEILAFTGLCCLTSCGIGIAMGRDMRPEQTQSEITLGDGTKATCVIVRDAGVTCVPHIVLGPDAEENKP